MSGVATEGEIKEKKRKGRNIVCICSERKSVSSIGRRIYSVRDEVRPQIYDRQPLRAPLLIYSLSSPLPSLCRLPSSPTLPFTRLPNLPARFLSPFRLFSTCSPTATLKGRIYIVLQGRVQRNLPRDYGFLVLRRELFILFLTLTKVLYLRKRMNNTSDFEQRLQVKVIIIFF